MNQCLLIINKSKTGKIKNKQKRKKNFNNSWELFQEHLTVNLSAFRMNAYDLHDFLLFFALLLLSDACPLV